MNSGENPEELTQRAVALAQAGNVAEGIVLFRRAVELRPGEAIYRNNLGLVLSSAGDHPSGVAQLEEAVRLRPDYADAWSNLGNALTMMRKFEAAVEAYERAVGIRPDFAQALSNMSLPLKYLKRHDEAIAAGRKGLALRPNSGIAHYNLGAALEGAEEFDEALEHFRRAVELKGDFPQAQVAVGNTLKALGRLDEAIEAYGRAAEKGDLQAYSNLAFAVHYHPEYDAAAILKTQRGWSERFAAPLAREVRPHENNPDPERRLRVGLVSGDLRDHSVGRVMVPILEHHDRNRFEIFCYSDGLFADAISGRLRGAAEGWREIIGLPDAEVGQKIREDKIDILVDLALQTGGNRLLVFARRPAPVQATYLAYCSTSGMETMDWRVSDPWLDPPGWDESVYSERTIRLARTYWCYLPQTKESPVAQPPAGNTGYVTFGCQNNFCKLTGPAWGAWIEILRGVTNSKLLIYAPRGSPRSAAQKRLTDAGIDPDRLEFVSGQNYGDYLQTYSKIDIGLDPFPYGGGITTCDAIWMGVPVVTLRGRTGVGRGGASILGNLELPELVAQNVDEYIQIAVGFAGDLPRLTRLRGDLRGRMERSPLMDEKGFARGFEDVLRKMWHNWCGSRR
jgi:protein O-GlcNAc transferase